MYTQRDFDGAIKIALRTWYPEDHYLHLDPHHPLGKLVGEWGELLDDVVKLCYKPGFRGSLLYELGDIWYYMRILCYQKAFNPTPAKPSSSWSKERLLSHAIKVSNNAYEDLLGYDRFEPYFLTDCYGVLLALLKTEGRTLQELTELNWQKLRPGSQRGKEWKGENW